jgi:hypothetical protein
MRLRGLYDQGNTDKMPDRSWFYAANGRQQGPFPEAQLRDLVTRGTIRADTLVWTEGMSGWQRAADVPGLVSGGAPPTFPQSGGPVTSTGDSSSGALSIDFGIWDFTWRTLVLLVSFLFIIPVPWAVLMYCRWIVSCLRVPQRPNLAFTGRAVDLMWFYAFALLVIVGMFAESEILSLATNIGQLVLYWLLIKWLVMNLSSNGQPLGLRFSGSFWVFLGYNLLGLIAILTIIGWAWVYVAQVRWMCRHIDGTRREVVFKGTGLEFLWRSIVTLLASIFIIPIPWMYRWMTGWLASQTVLVERGAVTNA